MSKDISSYIQGLVSDEDAAAEAEPIAESAVTAAAEVPSAPQQECDKEIAQAREMEAAMAAENAQAKAVEPANASESKSEEYAEDAEVELARQMEAAMEAERLEAQQQPRAKANASAVKPVVVPEVMPAKPAAPSKPANKSSAAPVPAVSAAVIDAAAAFAAVANAAGVGKTSSDDDEDDAPPVVDARRRYVSFNVAGQCYALPIASVQEVLPMPNLMPVPGAPPQCPGVVNLRGEIVTALDLRRVMGLPPTEASSLVVLNDGLALCVDTIGSIINAVPNGSEAPPNIGAARPFVGGITRHEGRFILLLDEQMLESALPSANAA